LGAPEARRSRHILPINSYLKSRSITHTTRAVESN
jgi:hypothetical protein